MNRSLAVALFAAVACVTLTSCVPAPPTVSEAEVDRMMAERENGLIQYALSRDFNIDDIPALVQWVTMDEAPEAWAQCMRDGGIDASAALDGGIGWSGDPETASFALWECTAMYSVDPRTTEPLTNAQFHTIYNYFDGELRLCLGERGYVVDQAPTEREFIDEYGSTGNTWSPYDKVLQGDLSDESWAQVQVDCPRMPPITELYGPPLPQP